MPVPLSIVTDFEELAVYDCRIKPDQNDRADKALHDRMVQLVEQMLSLQNHLPAAKTGHDQTHIQRQIEATDRQIDMLVYELYGLTEEEIAVVEGKS
jgi:hypothetical protein